MVLETLQTMTITFLFPGHAHNPRGGNKMVYEYANRLVSDGHQVHIVYAGSIFYAQKKLLYKLSGCYRYIERYFKGYSCRNWFNLNKHIKEYWAFSLNERHVPKSDIYICTSPYTAMYLNEYNIRNERKYYFIQDYERWGNISDEKLRQTYHYPFHKIVVSQWLKEIINEEKLNCDLVSNGFDLSTFKITTPIESRNKFGISMVYSPIIRKGYQYGIEAIYIVKEKYPLLQVTFFGTTTRPKDLPQWIQYFQSPSMEKHIRINNESSIYIGSSIQEGWGLPVGEAMACGQAVICTDNPGYMEMAINGKNALISPIRDYQKMAENIIRLIEDDELRYRIAHQGYEHIQQFSIEDSYLKFKRAINA